MELTGPALDAGERYKKIVADTARLDALLVDLFLDWHGEQPERIVLDVDATDDPLHGRQGRPLLPWVLPQLLLPAALYLLRPAVAGGAPADGGPGRGGWHGGGAGAHRGADPEALARGRDLAARGQRVLPRRIAGLVRGAGVEYVLGIAQNLRLKQSLAPELERARQECERTGQAARVFKDFRYRTLDSWSRERRVIGKAEHLPRGANPRFVVTSLGPSEWRRARSTRRCTARGAIWRTASRNSSWRCSPIAPRRRRCGPTSCACISPRSPTRCWSYCGAGACRARGWRGRNAARSA